MSEHNFSFIIDHPNSIFTFTHHIKPIIKEVNFDDEASVVSEDMVMEVNDGPPPSREYVHLIKEALLKTRKAFVEALHDHTHTEGEVKRWKLFEDYFIRKHIEAPSRYLL